MMTFWLKFTVFLGVCRPALFQSKYFQTNVSVEILILFTDGNITFHVTDMKVCKSTMYLLSILKMCSMEHFGMWRKQMSDGQTNDQQT